MHSPAMALFRFKKGDEPAGNPAPTGDRPNRDAVSEAVDICTAAAQDYLFKALAGRADAVGILNNRGSSVEEGWGGGAVLLAR